jgi:4-amino-4-deoxy-L-arabinose transferase-like glycosyltransferase
MLFKVFQLLSGLVFSFFIVLGAWGVFYEDDMPWAGFFWAGVTLVLYLAVRKVFMKK